MSSTQYGPSVCMMTKSVGSGTAKRELTSRSGKPLFKPASELLVSFYSVVYISKEMHHIKGNRYKITRYFLLLNLFSWKIFSEKFCRRVLAFTESGLRQRLMTGTFPRNNTGKAKAVRRHEEGESYPTENEVSHLDGYVWLNSLNIVVLGWILSILVMLVELSIPQFENFLRRSEQLWKNLASAHNQSDKIHSY